MPKQLMIQVEGRAGEAGVDAPRTPGDGDSVTAARPAVFA